MTQNSIYDNIFHKENLFELVSTRCCYHNNEKKLIYYRFIYLSSKVH